MKKIGISLLIVFAVLAWAKAEVKLGDKAPLQNYEMEDVSGESLTLATAKGEKGLLVIFSCNTCPFVLAWEDQYNVLYEEGQKYGINMVLVNSNEGKRAQDDSMLAMQTHAKEEGYKMPYLLDKNHQLADAFGAATTPHVYLFDAEMNLVYKGAIDNKYERADKKADSFFAKIAVYTIGVGGVGGVVEVAETQERGCTIKRLKK